MLGEKKLSPQIRLNSKCHHFHCDLLATHVECQAEVCVDLCTDESIW